MFLICQLSKTVHAPTATKCEQSLNVCDITVPRYICHFMRIICNHLRQGRTGKYRFIRTFSNVNMQNTAQIRASSPPFLALPSTTTRFLHKYAFWLPTMVLRICLPILTAWSHCFCGPILHGPNLTGSHCGLSTLDISFPKSLWYQCNFIAARAGLRDSVNHNFEAKESGVYK